MRTIFTLLFVITALLSNAQSFITPRSVAYDFARHRYIVADNGAQKLLSLIPGSAPTVLANGVSQCEGISIVGDTLYVSRNSIYFDGFSLISGLRIFETSFANVTLAGMCADKSGSVFAISSAPSKVVQYDISSQNYTNFRSLTSPVKGIAYDPIYDRLVISGTSTNAPIYGVNVYDANRSTLTTTTLSNLGGVATDADGNFFVDCDMTGSKGIYLFDSTFLQPPVKLISFSANTTHGYIYYNTLTDTLAVPENNTIRFFGIPHPRPKNDVDLAIVGRNKTICVLQNDSISIGGSLKLQSISTALHGTATINGNCIDYTGDTVGSDTIKYVACTTDTVPFCRSACLYLTVLDSTGNHAPVAIDNFSEATQLIADTINVTADDLDVEGDSLCVTAIIGSPRFMPDSANCSNIIFLGDSFFTGYDTCQYIVCDNDTLPLCDTGSLVVHVSVNPTLLPVADFAVDFNDFNCYSLTAVNTSYRDTGMATWIFTPQFGQSMTLYGDTAYYLNINMYGYYGDVCLYVSNQFGADSVCRFFNYICESVNDISSSVAFTMQPNPASNYVSIRLNSSINTTVSFEIKNLNGQLLSATAEETIPAGVFTKNIRLETLSSGLYIIGCKTNAGILYKKLIVQH